jgi:hypothetical protein
LRLVPSIEDGCTVWGVYTASCATRRLPTDLSVTIYALIEQQCAAEHSTIATGPRVARQVVQRDY